MGYYLLPKFLDGYEGNDLYGSIGGYYPGNHEFYNQRENKPDNIELLRDYLYGRNYNSYNNIMNTLNYISQQLSGATNNNDTIQRGPNRGYIKPRKINKVQLTNKPSIRSKRKYYTDIYGEGGIR